jgi:methylthioribose-1-phosphate isomerase
MNNPNLPEFHGLPSPLVYREGGVDLIDQTQLPSREVLLRITDYLDLADAIRQMKVRGAPAIGIAAAYGIVLGMREEVEGRDLTARFAQVAAEFRGTRPTAVNLFWAIARLERIFQQHKNGDPAKLREALLAEARQIHKEDVEANQRMGEHGAAILPQAARVLTICNAGALATGGYGTALGVVRAAWERGRLSMVYACETRPLLQGSRLTAWELLQEGIPFRLIVDSAAGYLMAKGKVDAVLAGADRIAQNGDVANKIGTYTLAVLAHHHRIPLYVVAPTSTVDTTLASGEEIPIEERAAEEVLAPRGIQFASKGARVWNPAFDVTPAELISGIVTENGVLRPPYYIEGNHEEHGYK